MAAGAARWRRAAPERRPRPPSLCFRHPSSSWPSPSSLPKLNTALPMALLLPQAPRPPVPPPATAAVVAAVPVVAADPMAQQRPPAAGVADAWPPLAVGPPSPSAAAAAAAVPAAAGTAPAPPLHPPPPPAPLRHPSPVRPAPHPSPLLQPQLGAAGQSSRPRSPNGQVSCAGQPPVSVPQLQPSCAPPAARLRRPSWQPLTSQAAGHPRRGTALPCQSGRCRGPCGVHPRSSHDPFCTPHSVAEMPASRCWT
mmetsp:Transcript_17067/g.46238  ORF Transcript_17067/g.46238 Transcript_17067/m.46238 type:complete len:253 (+) Transcript_17067:654-1412(+)